MKQGDLKKEQRPLLNDPDVQPSEKVLKTVLGKSYIAYNKVLELLTGEQYGLVIEWRFYNDGKAWLCKVLDKKKTVFWLSVWEGYFKVAFYFTEKHLKGVEALEIDKSIKIGFKNAKYSGKLRPLIIKVSSIDQLDELLKVIEFKKSLR